MRHRKLTRGTANGATRLVAAIALAALFAIAGGCEEARSDNDPPAPSAEPARPVTAPEAARPGPMPVPLREAGRLLGQGRFAAARNVARQYARGHPEDGRARFLIALTYHKAGNHAPAVPWFEQALELSPGFVATRHHFGECLFLLGDLAGARREHEAHGRADPAEPEAQYGIGLVDLEETRLDDAETRFRRAIALFEALGRSNPRLYAARAAARARCHARLADVHFARGEYEPARDQLLAATRIAPGNISAFYALSLVHRRLGEDELADAALRRYQEARAAIVAGRTGSDG